MKTIYILVFFLNNHSFIFSAKQTQTQTHAKSINKLQNNCWQQNNYSNNVKIMFVTLCCLMQTTQKKKINNAKIKDYSTQISQLNKIMFYLLYKQTILEAQNTLTSIFKTILKLFYIDQCLIYFDKFLTTIIL